MTERVMSEREMFESIQESSTRGVKSSLSTACGARSSRPSTKKRTKHKYDLANEKLIPSIFLDYILPLADAVSRDSVPRYFKYSMITAYLLKGIHVVQAQ
jgi:hypothetical protein